MYSEQVFSKTHFKSWIILLIVVLSIITSSHSSVTAQTPALPACNQLLPFIQKQLATNCNKLNRNEVCYGNSKVAVSLYPSADKTLEFANAGDVVPISAIQSITTDPLDLKRGEWGLAVMKIQARLPGTTTGQAVTFLLYGDTKVTNAMTSSVTPSTCSATTTKASTLRMQPRPNQRALANLPEHVEVRPISRTADNLWVMVDHNGIAGWLAVQDLKSACDLAELPITDPASPAELTAIGAFYLTTGIGPQSECKNIPSGLVIQSPSGSKVAFRVNGVDVVIGSTVVLHAIPGHQMTLAVIRGQASVKANNRQQAVLAGQQISIPLGDNLEPRSVPDSPQDIEDKSMNLANTCGTIQTIESSQSCQTSNSSGSTGGVDDKGGAKATSEPNAGNTSGGSGSSSGSPTDDSGHGGSGSGSDGSSHQ